MIKLEWSFIRFFIFVAVLLCAACVPKKSNFDVYRENKRIEELQMCTIQKAIYVPQEQRVAPIEEFLVIGDLNDLLAQGFYKNAGGKTCFGALGDFSNYKGMKCYINSSYMTFDKNRNKIRRTSLVFENGDKIYHLDLLPDKTKKPLNQYIYQQGQDSRALFVSSKFYGKIFNKIGCPLVEGCSVMIVDAHIKKDLFGVSVKYILSTGQAISEENLKELIKIVNLVRINKDQVLSVLLKAVRSKFDVNLEYSEFDNEYELYFSPLIGIALSLKIRGKTVTPYLNYSFSLDECILTHKIIVSMDGRKWTKNIDLLWKVKSDPFTDDLYCTERKKMVAKKADLKNLLKMTKANTVIVRLVGNKYYDDKKMRQDIYDALRYMFELKTILGKSL